jgi:hypothetical protein
MTEAAERSRDPGPIQPAGPLRPLGPLDYWRERSRRRDPERKPTPPPATPREGYPSAVDERA